MAGGPAGRVGGVGVGGVVGDVERVGARVDLDPERVAQSHRVDLGTGPRRALEEEVALRDLVAAAVLGGDAQHLPAQVVGVRGGALGVEGRVAVGALVDRHVAVGLEGVGVVSGGQDQVAVRVEDDVPADVAADAAVHRDVEDPLLGAELDLPVGEPEAGHPDHALEGCEVGWRARDGCVALVDVRRRRIVDRRVLRRRVVEVDPVLLRAVEAWLEGDALQPLLVVLVDVEPGGH